MEQVRNETGVPIPKNLTGLREREARHKDVIDREQMLDYVLKKASQKEWF